MGEESSRPSWINRRSFAFARNSKGNAVEKGRGADRDRSWPSGSSFGPLLKRLARSGYGLLSNDLDATNGLFEPERGKTVVEPRSDRDGYWAGALTAYHHEDDGEVYLCYRIRGPDQRGHTAVVARTGADAAVVEPLWSVRKGDLDAQSIEGGALHENDGVYTLYLSYQDANTDEWNVAAIPGDSAAELAVDRAVDIDLPTGRYENVKDPFVYDDALYVNATTSKFVSGATFRVELTDPGFDSAQRIEIADDESADNRLTSNFATERAEIALYDWKRSMVFTGEEKHRIGTLSDGVVTPLLTDGRSVLSPHGSRSLRYVSAVPVDEEIRFYYEMAMPGNGHETRVYVAPRDDVERAIAGFLGG